MRRFLSTLAATALGVVALTGGSVASASAPVGSAAAKGVTRVAIDPDVYSLMQSFGISVDPTGKATAEDFEGTIALLFPIKSDKKHGKVIKHTGGLEMSGQGETLDAKNLIIYTAKAEVTAVTSGSAIGDEGRIPLFTITDTDNPDLGDSMLLLTQEGADAFNATVGFDVVSAGDKLAYATIDA